MRLAPYFLLLTLTQIVCGLAAGRGRSPLGRVFAILFATLALAFPLAVPADHPAVRGILALGLAMALFRTIDLAREGRDRRERTALWRVLHVAIPFDTRRIAAAAPSFSATAFLRAVDHLAVALAAFYVAIHYGAFTSTEPVRLLVRWSGALVAAVAITEAAYGLAAILIRGAGFSIYELHLRPLASRSVQEFWGERWNLTITRYFREHCVRPLARHGLLRTGLLASFFASALLHAYLVLVAVDLAWAVPMFLYFVVQAALVFVERALGQARWPTAARRTWTFAVMIATAPLFLEPFLRVLGV